MQICVEAGGDFVGEAGALGKDVDLAAKGPEGLLGLGVLLLQADHGVDTSTGFRFDGLEALVEALEKQISPRQLLLEASRGVIEGGLAL
ncbi:MAG: hypothetical protein HY873_12795, partial [Chloroflexi bacterium]|nr:hypothetical protein [Chloroflexota bacterium]